MTPEELNYRAACEARSRREFVAKLGVAEEEGDKTQFWLEMIMEHGSLPAKRIQSLYQESREITAIIAASRKSASRGDGK
jgi:four helix bundle protein